MGGTGLEPVTPTLSSPPNWCSLFAKIGAFRRVCSGFLGFSAVAFAHVSACFRVLVLARVSTARMLRRLPRNDERAGVRDYFGPPRPFFSVLSAGDTPDQAEP